MTHALTVPSRRLAVAAACCAALVAAAAPDADAAPKLKRGIYDCMAYNYSSGFLDYKGSIKLKGKKRYEHTFGREDRKMVDKTKGKYRVKGGKIRFKRGAMDDTRASIEEGTGARKEPFFNLLFEGEPSGISCYYVRNP